MASAAAAGGASLGKRKATRAAKAGKLQAAQHAKPTLLSPSLTPASVRPFGDFDESDHCETPMVAYRDGA